jgi:hypothetical protein
MFDPARNAVRWYFRELSHEDLPAICIEALEHGYDGPMLRRLAGLVKPTSRDIAERQIEGAFHEMGIAAPISERECQLFLATETARAAAAGTQNPFDAATHIRIGICHFKPEPSELAEIVRLSEESERAPRWEWGRLEKKIRRELETVAKCDLRPRLALPHVAGAGVAGGAAEEAGEHAPKRTP